MSGDPSVISDGVGDARNAFQYGDGNVEDGFDDDLTDAEIQLRKACRLLAAGGVLRETGGYHTAVVELSFGVIERSFEFYALAMSADALQDFSDHTAVYDRAFELGVVSGDLCEDIKALYDENRTASYYGDRSVDSAESQAMYSLARETHQFLRDHPPDHFDCICT
jgi:hypothetical protein